METKYIVLDDTDIMTVKCTREIIKSRVNNKITWKVDYRPFYQIGNNENNIKLYKADDTTSFEYHKQDEEFIETYEPIIKTTIDGKEFCNDIKLPSGRWIENITVDLHTETEIILLALIDAYGTYNEQR